MPWKNVNLSLVLAGQRVGLKEVEEKPWLVSFMKYDLGYVDLEEKCLQPLENPFGPLKVSPMCPEQSVTRVSGTDRVRSQRKPGLRAPRHR
jgi:hypothetical protein